MALTVGIRGKQHTMVDESNTANTVGSGMLPVFSTPSMIALMEATAMNSVAVHLALHETTVGTLMNVKHLAATPVGMVVRAETELTEVDGRRLIFKVAAYDEAGLIGEGQHERFIVNGERFLAKTNAKTAVLP